VVLWHVQIFPKRRRKCSRRLSDLKLRCEFNSHSPNWFSESFFVLIYSLQENLEFVVENYHRMLGSSVIGRATFPLSVLANDPIRTGEKRPILKITNEVNGTLLFDIFYYPILHSDLIKELKSTSRTLCLLKIRLIMPFAFQTQASSIYVFTKQRKLNEKIFTLGNWLLQLASAGLDLRFTKHHQLNSPTPSWCGILASTFCVLTRTRQLWS
jgi:hypothetical protein